MEGSRVRVGVTGSGAGPFLFEGIVGSIPRDLSTAMEWNGG